MYLGMSTISRLVGAFSKDERGDRSQPAGSSANLDGALDTVSSMLRVMGSEAFALEDELDTLDFQALCAEFARHVENLPESRRGRLLPRAVLSALHRFTATRNIQDVSTTSPQHCESESDRLDSELSMVR